MFFFFKVTLKGRYVSELECEPTKILEGCVRISFSVGTFFFVDCINENAFA